MELIIWSIIFSIMGSILNCYSQNTPAMVLQTLEKYPLYIELNKALEKPHEVIRLDLSQKELVKVPSEVFLFTNLQELNLSENAISELPQEISKLKNLRYLNLYKNKLKTIPSEIVELRKLQVLLLSKNRIELMPSSIRGLKNLIYLDVSNNNLSTYEIDYLYEHLPNCTIQY